MTRDELCAAIRDDLKTAPASDGADLVRDVIRAAERQIVAAVTRGDSVHLYGFGTFSLAVRGPRNARNPQTGESVDVGERRILRFKAGRGLRNRLSSPERRLIEAAE